VKEFADNMAKFGKEVGEKAAEIGKKVASKVAPKPVTCPHCKTSIFETDVFCYNCGGKTG
jgi:hypothetical protein